MKRPNLTEAEARSGDENAPFKRRGRIVLSLLAVLIVVALGPLALVAWKLIDINRERLKTSHQEYQLLLAGSVAQQLDVHMEGLRTQLVRLSRALAPASARHGRDLRSRVSRILSDEADGRMLQLRYEDLRGNVVDWRVSPDGPVELETILDGVKDRVLQDLAEGADPGPDPVTVSVEPVAAGDQLRAALVLSTPVISRGTLRGVLSAWVDLESVWGAVLAGHRSAHDLFVADESGRLLAATDIDRLRVGMDMSGVEIVARFLASQSRGETQTLPFDWEEQGHPVRYLGSYGRTKEGWGIFVLARERQVYLEVSKMRNDTLRWSLGALCVAILAAIFFAGTLSKPINRLAAASRSFAAGDFSARVKVRTRNEIGELAYGFNRMASKIEDNIHRLKRAAQENNELFLGTIRALAEAIDAKDPYTRGHSVRVNRFSVIIARYLGLSEEEIRDIHVASLLHDVGKIGVDDSILKKPGALTQEEFAVMKTHTTLGAKVMAPIKQMKNIIPGLRSHHERMNGKGYPEGLTGQEIPLMARIIAVADTFDAMTTERPYQRAMAVETAVARINELKTVLLDEKVVEAFNRAYRTGALLGAKEKDQNVPIAAASA